MARVKNSAAAYYSPQRRVNRLHTTRELCWTPPQKKKSYIPFSMLEINDW